MKEPKPGQRTLDEKLSQVNRPMMSNAQGDEIRDNVPAPVQAPVAVMKVDKDRIATTRYPAPPLVAMPDSPPNRRRNLLRRAGRLPADMIVAVVS
jgi:hypothetical protein